MDYIYIYFELNYTMPLHATNYSPTLLIMSYISIMQLVSFWHTNCAVLSLPTRLTDTLSIPAFSMLFTDWMARLFVTSSPLPPLLALAAASNTHTMGAAGNGANLWNKWQTERKRHLLTFITNHTHTQKLCQFLFMLLLLLVLDFILTPVGCMKYCMFANCSSFSFFLSVFLNFILSLKYMDIPEINPVIFCVLLVDHAGSQLAAALHHDCREPTSCCGYILNEGI